MSTLSTDKTKSFVNPTLLFFGCKFSVGAKFAGKILGVVRKIILLTSIIMSGVVVGVVAAVLGR